MKVKFNFWIEEKDLRKLKRVADAKGLNSSAYVRMIIKEKLDQEGRK